MTEKEIVLETIRALPDDCSLEEIAERVEFMAAVQKGLDQLDRGEGIPHDELKKKQLASWLTN
jgi:predicted transcriptional regulator